MKKYISALFIAATCLVSCSEKQLEVSVFDVSLQIKEDETVFVEGSEFEFTLLTNRKSITIESIYGPCSHYTLQGSAYSRPQSYDVTNGMINITGDAVRTVSEPVNTKISVKVIDDVTGMEKTISIPIIIRPKHVLITDRIVVTTTNGFTQENFGNAEYGHGFIYEDDTRSIGEYILNYKCTGIDDKGVRVDINAEDIDIKIIEGQGVLTNYTVDKVTKQIILQSKLDRYGKVVIRLTPADNKAYHKDIVVYRPYTLCIMVDGSFTSNYHEPKELKVMLMRYVDGNDDEPVRLYTAPSGITCKAELWRHVNTSRKLAADEKMEVVTITSNPYYVSSVTLSKFISDFSHHDKGLFKDPTATNYPDDKNLWLYFDQKTLSGYNPLLYRIVGEYHYYRKSSIKANAETYFWDGIDAKTPMLYFTL